ncbi:extracellular solute-binding protein [Acetobacterium sp.]|uniref:extracellular solute-binding protein n=1 Tax=Acetobacterium sp. TaxID=1872094 RepID=UPI00359461B2
MNKYFRSLVVLIAVLIIAGLIGGCTDTAGAGKGEVVVYTSVDQVYSEKIFADFEQTTGIRVNAVYDIESNKTVGLANRLIAEMPAPQSDVFWSGEILQTIALKQQGVFEPVDLTAAANLPANYVDPDKCWFGFGGRARVYLYNKTLVAADNCPHTMLAIPASEIVAKTGMAYPIFGTTNTEAAVLYASWGEAAARNYYQSLKDVGIQVIDGNSVVKDFVSQKKLTAGLTDTDDALSEMKKNADLGIIFLDQGAAEMGAMVIPNTVARVKNGPNPDNATRLMNYLLSASTEQALVDDGWIHIPVHQDVKPAADIDAAQIKIMTVDFNQAYEMLNIATNDMTEIFAR